MQARQKILNGHESVKVAIVQTPPAFLDKDATIDIACAKIAEAAKNGANIIAFSETWVAGYPYWGEGWESHLPDWVDVRTRFYDNAMMIPSDDTRRLCNAAKKANAVVIIGCNELDSDPAVHTIYNTLLFIDNHGQILGKHRKVMPTFVERAFWGNGDASGMRSYPTDFGRIGGLICGEHLMTLARAHMIAQGEDIHLGVFPGAFSLHTGPSLEEPDSTGDYFWGYASSRAHSFEAGAFVMTSCGIMNDESLPDGFPMKDSLNIGYAKGGSAVYAPIAIPLVGPTYGDTIVYADCPAQMIKVAKAIIDTRGHYARNDLFELKVNTPSPTPSVHEQNIRAVESISSGELRRIADRYELSRSEIVEAIEAQARQLEAIEQS
ncbi:MAG TPA: carbon-nitrogen hydrolase family protein [Burkholderiaceae bacterium]|nr:carbon-nitrogen hydrolase family protein [Burkholderiaceae bacterium]